MRRDAAVGPIGKSVGDIGSFPYGLNARVARVARQTFFLVLFFTEKRTA
jgi:hypothetical protein